MARAIHAGEIKDPNGSPHTPIYNTTTFAFPFPADLLDVVDGRKPGSLYTRYGLNPTMQALEEKLASLEVPRKLGCSVPVWRRKLRFSSRTVGMARLHWRCLRGTLELLTSQLPLLGISTHLILGRELGKLGDLLDTAVKLVFFETPTNPTLEIFDIRAIACLWCSGSSG
jgi:cystathionine gamma-synthase